MLAIPLSMVLRKEYALREGQVVRLRLAPVDPIDHFRGRFMALRFELEQTKVSLPEGLSHDDETTPAYALLSVDQEGFATLTGVQLERPAQGHWLTVRSIGWDGHIRVPFSRYYLNEEKAPRIEKQARELMDKARKAGAPCPVHAVVRLHDGEGTLVELRGPDGPLTGN